MAPLPHSMFRARTAGPGYVSLRNQPSGEITGFYDNGTDGNHGFLRDKKGVITTFDVPGAGTGPGQGTFGGGLTPSGAIMGNYLDADNVSHGFLRDKKGAITTFDAPDAGNVPGSFQGTYPFGINTNGAITGWYVDEANVNHGFVRDKHGELVEFDVPGAGTGPCQGPNVYSIAPNGAVTGFFFDPDNVVHGFVREADGALGLPNLTDSNSWPTDTAAGKRHSLPESSPTNRLSPVERVKPAIGRFGPNSARRKNSSINPVVVRSAVEVRQDIDARRR